MPSDVAGCISGWLVHLAVLETEDSSTLIGCIHLWTSIIPLPLVAKCVVTGRREVRNRRQLSCLRLNLSQIAEWSLCVGWTSVDATADRDVDVTRALSCCGWLIRIALRWSLHRLAGCLISLRPTRPSDGGDAFNFTAICFRTYVDDRAEWLQRLNCLQRSPHPAERVRDAVGWLPAQWTSLFSCFMILYRRFYGNS